MAVEMSNSGSTSKTMSFLNSMRTLGGVSLDSIAQRGVAALQAATPVTTGLAAASWSYEITSKDGSTTISWLNSDVEGGVNVIILLQYGHATGTGGYVAGYDFINPAIQPIFDEIANELWKKVTSA